MTSWKNPRIILCYLQTHLQIVVHVTHIICDFPNSKGESGALENEKIATGGVNVNKYIEKTRRKEIH